MNDDDVIMTPNVIFDGVKYTLVPWTCGRCGNTFFTADHVEFNPVRCCYCGIRIVWYEDGKTGQNRLQSGRIKPGKGAAKFEVLYDCGCRLIVGDSAPMQCPNHGDWITLGQGPPRPAGKGAADGD